MKTGLGLSLMSCVVAAALAAPAAMASTVTMTFNDDLSGTTLGTATLSITDIGANEIQATLTPNFAGASLQTITGLWLNDPGLTSLTVAAVSPTPNAYVSPAAYTATQTTVPGGTTAAVSGQYDTYVKFSNSSPVIRGTTAEVFDITGTGGTLSATTFNLTDAPKNAGDPADFYGLIGLTNYLGTSGSGTGYIAATSDTVTPVPIPAAVLLLCSGLGGLYGFARRKPTQQMQATCNG